MRSRPQPREGPAPKYLMLGTYGGHKRRYFRGGGPMKAKYAYAISRERRKRGERGTKVIRFEEGYYLYHRE